MRITMAVTNDVTHDSRVRKESASLARLYDVSVVGINGQKDERTTVNDGVRIFLVPTRRKKSLLSSIMYYRSLFTIGTSVQRKLFQKLLEVGGDVFHAHDLDTLAPCYYAAKKTGAKLVYDSHELFPDTIDEFNSDESFYYRTYHSCAAGYYRWLEKKLIQKADVILTVSDSLAKELRRRYALTRTPNVLYNTPLKHNVQKSMTLHKSLHLPEDAILIVNHGNIGRGRGYDVLIESVGHFPPAYHLVIIGDGPFKAYLQNLVRSLDLQKQVHFLPPLDQKELLRFLPEAHVGIVLLESRCENERVALPNKFFDYLMCGVPVLATAQAEMSAIILKHRVGATIHEMAPKTIFDGIQRVVLDPTYAEMRERTLLVARHYYNWEIEEVKLLNIYFTLTI